ncbi:focadhesin-like [Acanthaster planci]|uniref:Focadhesin-like n=1 Tax=Acanthaster planci TaxID=133434 RepID=A0A8B7ZJN9_ACAPL|nr:focadhesin-like [Acanthaster planci]
MAEDLKRRLHFGDPGLRLGAAAKLFSQVVKEKEKIVGNSGPINSQTPQITELKILWDQCTVESNSVSVACSETLVSLVRDGHADFSFVMKGLLNVIPSAVNCLGAVRALRQLLLLDMQACIASEGTYRCRFGLRNPPHPFISALTSRPDSWPFILQEVSKLLSMTDARYSCYTMDMLAPFLSYVLLNPTIPHQLTTFKVLLAETLLQVASSTSPVAVDACTFFLDCLHQIKIDSLHELSEVNSYLVKLASIAQTHKANNTTLLKSLSAVAFSLCKECVTLGHDLTPCLKVIDSVIESHSADLVDESVVCFLSWLTLKALPDQLRGLLCVAQKVVTACEHEAQGCASSLKMLILPLLWIVSTPIHEEIAMEKQERLANQRQASQLLSNVSRIIQQAKRPQVGQKAKTFSRPSLHAGYQLMQSCGHLSHTLLSDPTAARDWLSNLQSNLPSVDSVPALVVLTVSSLFWEPEVEVARASLNVLINIATQDCSWAPSLVPLLLYRLSQEHDPVMTFDLLCTIPKTATHKVCMTAVIRALQSLAVGDTTLTPLVVRLTTQLWKLQDRSFPHLQKLLSQSSFLQGREDLTYELLLAKAASIRDVCELRPHRGADLLPMLSKLLNDCTSDGDASIAALALDALYILCQAEVVDLRTMWAVLSPKLTKDERPLVMQNLCKLLGSAPALLADTQDCEDFCDEVVELLWQYSNHGNPAVSAAAFTALAIFQEDDFTLDDLPPEIAEEEKTKIEAMKAKQKETDCKAGKMRTKEEEDEEEGEAIPPSCYIKLLMSIHEEVLPAYQLFLSSLLVEEVKNLPRGVHKSAIQRQQTVNRGKTLDNVPSLLLNRFERIKQPGLKPGLAVGLLCSFEPKKETSQQADKPGRRHVINKGRAYQHMINTLMNELCVDSTDWFELMQLPHAWMSLMQNALQALIQSRCAELELQRSHGHLDESQADFQVKMDTAWLWVRDKLTDQIKTAAKSNPSAQSNSVLALAGLAVVSTRHFLALDNDGDDEARLAHQSSMQHTGQNHWLGVVIDTLLCLLGVKLRAGVKIFTWYQQHSGDLGASLPSTVQGNSALALSLLAPFLLTTDTQQLHRIMDVLIDGLPGQPRAHQSQARLMHHGLALGMLTARLYEDHYLDYTGSEGEVKMIRLVDALESTSLNAEDQTTSCGQLLGLAMVLSAMSTEGAVHTKAHVANMHHKLLARLDVEDKDTLFAEALCMCIGCVTAAGFQCNIISPGEAFDVAVKLQTLCQQQDQNAGIAVSTGVMFHSLVGSSHPSISHLLANLFSTWSTSVTSQATSVQQKRAAIYGLTGLVTGTGLVMQSGSQTQMTSDMHNKRTAVAKQLNQLLTDWADPAIQNAAASLLGYLHLVSSSSSESSTGTPSSYSYLSETSLLRTCIDHLILASKMGPELIPARRLETLLTALAGRQGSMLPLPPVNWTAVLSPILRLPYGEKVHGLCMELALSQCQRPSTSLLCVTAWLSPSIFSTLKESCKTILYGALPALIRAVPANKLKPFVETNLMEPFRVVGVHMLDQCEVIVDSLLAALRIPDPAHGIVIILHKAVKDIYSLIPATLLKAHSRVLAKLAQCLCHLPGEDIDTVTSPLAQNGLLKSTFIRSYIVCQGKQSLMWLNPCVDVAMNVADSSQRSSLVGMLLVALAQCDAIPSQHTAPMHRVHWLLELMGHTRNVAHAKTQLAPNRPIYKAVQILLDVFATAVVAWSSKDLHLILAIAPSWLTAQHGEQGSRKASTSRARFRPTEHYASEDVSELLPYGLPLLLKREPWSQITEKVLNWLLDMYEVEHDTQPSITKLHLKATILTLRHTPAFKKPASWTRVHIP